MSEYGPAIFCSRVDGGELSDEEQAALLGLVEEACEEIGVVDERNGERVSPWKYDYDGYEPGAVSFVLWSNYAFGAAPEFIQKEFHESAREMTAEIGAKIDEQFPGVYAFDGYYVEV